MLRDIDIIDRTVSILLIEDDNGDARAVERALRKERVGNPLFRVADGVEALEVLRGQHKEIQLTPARLLLVDLNMPRMGGLELIQQIRADSELHREIVFVLTTSSSDTDILAAYDLNIAGYITKQRAGADFVNLVGILDFYWRIIEFPVRTDV
ncbi:response regulator receiver protein [gamma proteobacterium BDW918]|uniref:Two-component system response regulator n=1 Tax=Zhongshania aliphaticivorans TaxID=1470434 RepID=A0A127M8P1_9GAMM|nr:response regulator [Zhongshania aliphaticivorans]AMO69589.1 two-component system response regulator [Zhongshania aliphaticivorans]EIF42246.1 response regulator receiver protein [gamma proteobacterium BDW918]